MIGSSSAEKEDASQLAEGEGDERGGQKSCHLNGVLVFFGCKLHAQGRACLSPFKFWFGIPLLLDD